MGEPVFLDAEEHKHFLKWYAKAVRVVNQINTAFDHGMDLPDPIPEMIYTSIGSIGSTEPKGS